MKLTFEYSKEKDIWCLLNKGKSSHNSPFPTKLYSELISAYGESPDENSTAIFIDHYLKTNNYDTQAFVKKYQEESGLLMHSFEKVAEKVFGISLDKEITAYLTIHDRCPYNISENWFFVSMSQNSPARTIMHELWHFYTWYKFGFEEEKIGIEKYNDIKEALTVLLNVKCKHLLPEGIEDKGYPQHKKLRDKILELWKQNPNMDYVWKEALNFVG